MTDEAQSKDTSYFLEIQVGEYTTILHRMAFATKEEALTQLALLEPKIGLDRYRTTSNDPDNERHRVVSGEGEMVISTKQIQLARVIDRAAYDALCGYADRKVVEHLKQMAEITDGRRAPISEPVADLSMKW